MKTMKQAIVFLAVLAAGCAMPGLEKPAAPEPGVLRVSLGSDEARTLLPETYEVTSLYYTLTFTAAGGLAQIQGLGPVAGSIAVGESSGDFTLAEGTWDLAVKGFASQAGAADPAKALVGGGASGIPISASAGASISVALAPVESNINLTQDAAGTLAWNISFPVGVTQANLTVCDADGTPLALDKPNPFNLLIGANTGSLTLSSGGSLTLSSGVYGLELRLYMAGKAVVKGLTAHIYDRLVTRAAYTFTEADFAGYTTEAVTTFALNGGGTSYPGRIDHAARTITVFVPPNTDLRGLTAAATHAGLALASVPAPPDFSGPVTYTVTLEDGAEIAYTVRVSGNTVSTAAELAALLSGSSGGSSSADPVLVKINADLADTGGNGWADFLSAIRDAAPAKYVSLDLSDCTMAGTEFDPGAADTGERYVTGLALPKDAQRTRGSSVSFPTFRYFTSLTTLEASGVKGVGGWAFSGCTSLETVSLPAATSIGDYAFYNCTSLETVSLPVAARIGNWAFLRCTGLKTVSLPAATTIDKWAFAECPSLETVSLPAAASIGEEAFRECPSLETVSLPKATSIGEWAFAGCTGLKTVSLPAAASIGEYAFGGTGLETVFLPKAASIGKYAFEGCTSLKTVSLPAATAIGVQAFLDCTSLYAISLPATLTSIGNPFSGCVNLSSINVDPGNPNYTGRDGMLLDKAGTTLFAYPGASGNITLDGITAIGTYAFRECTSLETASLPAAASIDNSAFYRCTGLKTVSLPTAASIGEDAFYGCTSLETVSLPAATSIGEDAFLYCTGLKTVSLPAAASIGNGAFSGCTSLEKVSLPAAASIGKWAFSGAGETALTITLGAEAPWVGDSIFASISAKTVTVLVPSGATGYVPGTYSGTGTADNWGNAFRGKGWNGSGYLGSDVNSGVTLNIRYITP